MKVKNKKRVGLEIRCNNLLGAIKRRAWLFLMPAAMMVCGSLGHAAIINGVDFTTVYTGTSLPENATPAWTATVNGTTSIVTPNSPSAGILTIDTSTDYVYYSRIWSASTDTTLEISMQVDSVYTGNYASTSLYFTNGTKDYRIFFAPTAILVGDIGGTPAAPTGDFATYSFDTTGAFNTYRVTLESGSMSLYVNNSTTAAVSGYTGTANDTSNVVYFGDVSGTVAGVSEWEYLAFTNAGAYAPVPEPTSLGLFVAGLATVLLTRRRKQRLA